MQVSYVERLEDVVAAAHEFLIRDRDLFARPRIVVPSPGAKAWLWSELAKRLGAGDRHDGVIANVEISYPATIASLVQPRRDREPDPWSLDRLTATVLDVITASDAAAFGIPFTVDREPLLSARRIAALFDSYHVRRPAMILLWEKGRPAYSPMATPRDPEGSGGELPAADLWQFAVWRAVRERIGSPSPPGRVGLDHRDTHPPLLVAGLQSLSLHQITCLEALSAACDVRVLLVHPCPPLRVRWAAGMPQVSKGVPPKRDAAELADDLDPLVATWLHGARETQTLLASQGIRPEHLPAAAPPATAAAALLARLQGSIVSAVRPVKEPHDPATDRSFTVHCCHSLSRQAEVVHDAILHAFTDLPDLEPHEVAIVSPCLERLAPHLEAVFDREVKDGHGGKARLPLVIADRGLHEVSAGAELILAVLPLVGSRCSVEQFRAVAVHPLVRHHFSADDDVVRCWDQLIERSRIHWGFDAAHRLREGFPAAAAEAHTWRAGLERILLGAMLPDAAPKPELGGVVPLDDVPLSDLPAIQSLLRIFGLVLELDVATAAPRPVADWCTAIEAAVFGLCGDAEADLVEPLRVVRSLRETAGDTPVPFADVRQILSDSLRTAAGRQPFRTGAITATSMVPLRGVPFRLICVVGYDDGTTAVAESRGDDLVTRQPLAGDGDPRIDLRRTLLDCVLAARDRLVITCNGNDIKTNKPLPFVTPLAELIDFAVRHGVARPDPARPSGIEVRHPRHAVGRKNFRPDEVLPGTIWSHDAAAFTASAAMGEEERGFPSAAGTPPDLPVVELSMLEEMVRSPLDLYLRKTLGISTWRDDESFPAATFPLTIDDRDSRSLTRDLLARLVAHPGVDRELVVAEWLTAARGSGRVPFGRFGDNALREIRQLAVGIHAAAANGRSGPIPLAGFEAVPIRVLVPGRLLTGNLPGVHQESRQLVDVRVTKGDRSSWGLPLHVAALRLLLATAAGISVDAAVVVARHERWKPDQDTPAMIARRVTLAPELQACAAATNRLAAIADLLPLALASPCGRFGSTWDKLDDDEAARKLFAQFLDRPQAGSNEGLVYGPRPRFDDVFGATAPERRFHETFSRLFSLSRTYVLS